MDILKASENTYTIVGTYEEMLTIAGLFRTLDPRSWAFYTAANLIPGHKVTEAQVTDLSSKRLRTIASRLESSQDERHPILTAINNALSNSNYTYQPEL